VREREPGSALLIYHNLPLAKISLRLWLEDKGLKSLKQGASTTSPLEMPG
jgi:hypothetical protein